MNIDTIDNLVDNALDIAEEIVSPDTESLIETLDTYDIEMPAEEIDDLHSHIHSAVTEAIIAWGNARR